MAVYTEVSDMDLTEFLTDYDLPAVISLTGIAEGVENSNFLLQTEGNNYILTLYEKRVAHADLPFFLELMQHLAAANIRCPLPVAGRDGIALRNLKGRPASLVTFLPGLSPRRIEPFHCRSLGKNLAQFHLAAANFPLNRHNNLSVQGWHTLLENCAPEMNNFRPHLYDQLSEIFAQLQENWPDTLPIGTIHADLFPDNVFFRDKEITGIFDFYFACTDILAYDLAVCLNAWCFEPDGSFNITKAHHLVSGYDSCRKLAHIERMSLPILARGSALRFLLTRLYDWINHPSAALVRPKDPTEYLKKLFFHQTITDPAAYGLE